MFSIFLDLESDSYSRVLEKKKYEANTLHPIKISHFLLYPLLQFQWKSKMHTLVESAGTFHMLQPCMQGNFYKP